MSHYCMSQQFHSCMYIHKKLKSVSTHTLKHVFIAALFIVDKSGNTLNFHQFTKGYLHMGFSDNVRPSSMKRNDTLLKKNQSQKTTCCMISVNCSDNRSLQGQIRLVFACAMGGIARCKQPLRLDLANQNCDQMLL